MASSPSSESYRRRSPDRLQTGRRRSRSPPRIDRYQPDRSRDDYYPQRGRRDDGDRRRRSSPHHQSIDRYVPGQEPPTPAMLHNPLQNPMTFDFTVGFSWFAEWWRKEQHVNEERERQKNGGRRPPKGEQQSREEKDKERERIQEAYNAYKVKLQAQLAYNFVQQHKGEDWFRERYVPQIRDAFRQRLNEFRKRELYERFLKDLDAGLFDDYTLEGIYKSDSDGAGGVVEKEEGEATAATEVQGVGDLVPSKGSYIRDEFAQQPTLLVKTMAPTVSREKMEAFCKEHLGEGEAGLKWLSLSDPNPQKKCHRMGWIILNPASEESVSPQPEPERGDGRDEDAEMEDGVVNGDAAESGPMSTTKQAVEKINAKTIHDEEKGDFTCHVGIHGPPNAPRKKALWDLFSTPERVERDLQLATRLVNKFDTELGDEHDVAAKIEEKVEDMRAKGWLQPPITGNGGSKKIKDTEDGEADDDMLEEGEEEEEGAYEDETDDEELLAKKKKLDLLVEYLRRVYNFCFFCVFECDSVHELQRKCPGGHLRRPRATLTTSAKSVAQASVEGEKEFPLKRQESNADGDNPASPVEDKKFNRNNKNVQQLQRAFNWVKTYEDKLFQILDPDSVQLRKIGGVPLEEGLEEELEKYVKQEDEAKFRCKVPECSKLFKGINFWRKHVEKRHTEWFEKIQLDIQLINNYVLDPAHIAPSRNDANSNGHFPSNSMMLSGTPRGFTLANYPPGMNPAMTNVGFPNFFGQPGVSMPGNWGQQGDGLGGHRPGVMRRGGGRFNNRAPGPYDQDGRNARYTGGRLTPPRTASGRPMPGPMRLAEGGAGAMGPKEAVQGRSLKSYEDLDAVDGNANGGLDY